jgi:hypothetical protein
MVHLDDQDNTTFTTPWDTFMYSKMPFGFMNAGEIFQRDMDIAFANEKDKFIVIYLDDIIVYSVSNEEHLKHLRRDFSEVQKFWHLIEPQEVKFWNGRR